MASSTRRQIIEAVIARLQTIQIANGYTTQPAVCDDYDEAFGSSEQFAVYVAVGDEEFPEGYIASRYRCEFPVLVYGIVRKGASNPLLTDQESLLQDIRNAVLSYRESFKNHGGAALLTPGLCENDQGALSQVGRAYFVQPFTFQYVAGPTF